MNIIKEGRGVETKEFICGHCGCVFTATDDEYDLSFADRYEVRCWCKCPSCESVVTISEPVAVPTNRLKRAQTVYVVLWDGGNKKEIDSVFSSEALAAAYVAKQKKTFENLAWYYRKFDVNERTFVLKFDGNSEVLENEPGE